MSPLEQSDPMLTSEQLIPEATALTDAEKATLIDRIVESMTGQVNRDILVAGHYLDEKESGLCPK
jgi:hypothetical protein